MLVLKADLFAVYFDSLYKILVCGAKDVNQLKIIFYTRPTICNFISMLLGAISGVFLINGCKHLISGTTEILDFNILTINSLEFNFIIIMDFATFTFIGVVTLIASCVVFYSKDYIGNDPNIERFI